MKTLLNILIITGLASSGLLADSNKTITHIDKQIEKEKKYAKEQKFYSGDEYDLKGAEVDEKSLDSIDAPEPDDLDMDHVYD